METRAVDGFLWAESAAACYRCRSGQVAGRGWSPTGPVRVAHQGPWKSRTPQTQRRAIQNPHARQAAWRCVGRPRRSCLFRPARGSVAGQTPRHSAPCVARDHLRSIGSLGPPSLLPACASRFWPGVRSTFLVGRCSICGGRSTVARPSLRWAVGVVLSRDWSRLRPRTCAIGPLGRPGVVVPGLGFFVGLVRWALRLTLGRVASLGIRWLGWVRPVAVRVPWFGWGRRTRPRFPLGIFSLRGGFILAVRSGLPCRL